MKRKYIYLIFTILWMMLIFWFSSRAASESSGQSMFITERLIRLFIKNPSEYLLFFAEVLVRKTAHFMEYFILAFFVFNTALNFYYGKVAGNIKNTGRIIFISFIICLMYSISDEVHQYFVPGRACRAFDVMVDSIGSASFMLCYLLYKGIKKHKNNV